jgi:hypothetical protein
LDGFVVGFQEGDNKSTGLQIIYPSRKYIPKQVEFTPMLGVPKNSSRPLAAQFFSRDRFYIKVQCVGIVHRTSAIGH